MGSNSRPEINRKNNTNTNTNHRQGRKHDLLIESTAAVLVLHVSGRKQVGGQLSQANGVVERLQRVGHGGEVRVGDDGGVLVSSDVPGPGKKAPGRIRPPVASVEARVATLLEISAQNVHNLAIVDVAAPIMTAAAAGATAAHERGAGGGVVVMRGSAATIGAEAAVGRGSGVLLQAVAGQRDDVGIAP